MNYGASWNITAWYDESRYDLNISCMKVGVFRGGVR